MVTNYFMCAWSTASQACCTIAIANLNWSLTCFSKQACKQMEWASNRTMLYQVRLVYLLCTCMYIYMDPDQCKQYTQLDMYGVALVTAREPLVYNSETSLHLFCLFMLLYKLGIQYVIHINFVNYKCMVDLIAIQRTLNASGQSTFKERCKH